MENRLKILRSELHLSQAEFAKNLRISQATYAGWERGLPVSSSRIQAICQTFNVRREWLETGEGEMFAPKSAELDYRAAQRKFVGELWERLTDEQRAAMMEVICAHCERFIRAAETKTQTNNGTIGGDMIQK